MKLINQNILIFIILILLFKCENNTHPDNTPPDVSIVNPISGSTVSEIVKIKCISTDNDEILKLELWVDGISTNIIDEREPYILNWNTTIYENNSIHTITVRSYDKSDNKTDSEPIYLTVDNTGSYPSKINLNPIKYDYANDIFNITWSKCPDNDFFFYKLFESTYEDMSNKVEAFTSENIDDTSYTASGINENEIRYYQLVIGDTVGYETQSEVQVGDSHITFDNIYGIGQCYSICEISGGGYIVMGNSNQDIILLKLDNYGNLSWSQTYGGVLGEWSSSVLQTIDGGFIIAGYTNSFGEGSSDFWIIKTDESGIEEWNYTYGGDKNDECYDISQTEDHGYILIGETDSYGKGYADIWLVKIDKNGKEIWNRTFGSTWFDKGNAVKQTYDGGYILTGWGSEMSAEKELILIKTDSLGILEFDKRFTGSKGEYGNDIQLTKDNTYIVTGMTYSYGSEDEDILLLEFDSGGNVEWYSAYGGPTDNSNYDGHEGESVTQTKDGGYIITGYCWSKIDDDSNLLIIKTDAQGNIDWNKSYGSEDNDYGRCIIQTSDGGYVVAGGKSGNLWVLKTNPSGNVLP